MFDSPHTPSEPPRAEPPGADAPGSPNAKRQTPNTRSETTNSKHETPLKNISPLRAVLIVLLWFLSLFLVVRTALVEPFGVPTGSMAPALSGHHRDGFCPRCGNTVRVGRPNSGSETEHFARVLCWNCDEAMSLVAARELSGDRLLVDKNVYDLRRPRRWEMIVFRCPNPKQSEFGKPYVKRLVGLPGEEIAITDGDVYADGLLLRKDLRAVRETLVPVFDMASVPKWGGWAARWMPEAADDPRLPPNAAAVVAPGSPVEGAELVLEAADTPQSVAAARYRHWNLDTREEEPVRVWNAYNGYPIGRANFPTAHDFYLTCEVEVTAASGAPGEAVFGCRLTDGADLVTAEIGVGNGGHARLLHDGRGGLGTAGGVALARGRRHRVEFAFVDRRVTLAVDGRVAVPPADLPPAAKREGVTRPVRLAARGCRVVVRDFQLFRDLHYTTGPRDHGARPARLGPREFFVLGDNTQSSEDSRKWPAPGVPDDALIGKPFLIHQPLRLTRVTVGGRERVFQSLDWSRLRWVH